MYVLTFIYIYKQIHTDEKLYNCKYCSAKNLLITLYATVVIHIQELVDVFNI